MCTKVSFFTMYHISVNEGFFTLLLSKLLFLSIILWSLIVFGVSVQKVKDYYQIKRRSVLDLIIVLYFFICLSLTFARQLQNVFFFNPGLMFLPKIC